MQFDMRELPMVTRYKIVNSTITPRPIAWITSQSADGILNAAPYSFFNCVGTEPPLVVLGLLKEPASRGLKNTASNIIATGEFVVNLVCEADAEKMNLCSVDAPADVSEIDYAGVETAPSVVVAPPRIASSPVSFECRKVAAMDIGALQTVVIGEILMAHIRDEFISDRERVYFDTPAMKLIGRTHGSGWYVRNSDSFQMERPRYDPSRLMGKDKAAE
ncbi:MULTISPECIES: flavin reductase family protein [unclassified Sphingobium]|uniref:flavin reductase family protein n=1 Tax=unclassified Sphingobium TaxID=2611147 RepID=UPI0007704575|nr:MULTISPECIES: flavin reductase family protein [unclassified Sphingobium]AMK23370.1 flavin reductase domain-containing protein [Sphingobium sp. TKS]NML88903.1 flavin reductase family protein [Sphingobium sp. TB-6]